MQVRPTSSSTRSAFTLIEILIVLAIIALLAALLFPAFSRARESGRQTTCATNLHQISLAVQQYFQDERRYPDSLVDLLPEGADYSNSGAKAQIPENVNGYLKSGTDGLLCPNDDLTLDVPHSSYGSLDKTVAAKPTASGSKLTGADADPNAVAGNWAYNYWGYDEDGFAYPSSVEASATPAALLRDKGSAYSVRKNPVKYSLSNRFAPDSTIVTHCVFHRIQTANNLIAPGQLGYAPGTDSQLARDIVLRLDGSVKTVDVSNWKTFPGNNKWRSQTP